MSQVLAEATGRTALSAGDSQETIPGQRGSAGPSPPPRSPPPSAVARGLRIAAAGLWEPRREAVWRGRGRRGTEAYSAASQCYCPGAWP